jgi:hypothetical protein
MNKTLKIALLAGFFGLFTSVAKADIVIEGRAVSANHEGGNTYIKCKRKHAECIRIVSSTVVINFDDGTQETIFNIDGYEVLSENETDIDVVIYGGN